MITGTSCFVSFRAAVRYYGAYESDARQVVMRKLSEGEIHVGRPDTKPNERLLIIDDDTRWAIESVT